MIEAEKKVFANQFQNQMDFVSTKEAKQSIYAELWNDLAQSYRLYTLAFGATICLR
jgi:hypothetical protein